MRRSTPARTSARSNASSTARSPRILGERVQVGPALLEALIRRSEALGYRQLVAVIGDSAHAASINLHASFGFLRVGTLRSVGFKLGRWVDSVLMQRPLGRGDATPPS